MKDLLIVEGTLTPLSSKTHITYQFNIPGPAESLRIDFSYSPKVLDDKEQARVLIEEALDKYVDPSLQAVYKEQWEKFAPLKNLLTLSIDDPEGFRGSAHRHPNHQHHVLSPHESSPGFFAGPIHEGVWRVTISVHCVVTSECRYQLHIREGEIDHEVASI
ncbi:hypothetical protein BVG16_00630 [Paenibacillus selenitireducens]|uniref:Uncharacterized protein n=1 Tax=Paenibacillus selenitireducens TaxID=1324314 RepID=A0A1T2XM41_9BACL|nr:hypothetical protein [Paenibacillus selenitireducens]OPA80888.1 hypothetical protein BVG16_00630 [Paenibacillus selenitireducens]